MGSSLLDIHPVATLTKSGGAYHEIRARILDGTFQADTPLHQESLAVSLGISITPLREALRRLEAEGWVIPQAHKEVRVAPLTREELRDLYGVRLQLEPYAGGCACAFATEQDRQSARQLARVDESLDSIERLRVHRSFHRAVYAASGNGVLVPLLDSLWDRIDRYRVAILAVGRHSLPVNLAEHQEIADAFVDTDGANIRRLLTEHIAAALHEIETVDSDLW